jgi:hypothetical protein
VLAPSVVSNETPISIASPLRGEWIAGDSVNNRKDTPRRRTVPVADGYAWLAQRYAIDWLQIKVVDGYALPGRVQKTRTAVISATTDRSTASLAAKW